MVAGMGLQEVHRDAGERGFTLGTFAEGNGVPSSTFRRHARAIGWDTYHRGLWVPPGVEWSHRQQIAAALAVITGDVLVTGASGLLLHGILATAPEDVELLLPATRRLCDRREICFHRTRMFEQVRYQRVDGVPVAAVPRLFADHAPHSTVNDLCRDLATALRMRMTTLALIGKEVHKRKRFPGRANLRLAHGYLSGEVNHSDSERLGKRLLRDDGLEFHPSPLSVEHNGRMIAELDIPFPELLYAVEIDGPHHLLPHVAAADRQRDRSLHRIHWHVDRFFWFELEDRPDWFVSQVRKAVAERGAVAGR
jgi:hypothetical protein